MTDLLSKVTDIRVGVGTFQSESFTFSERGLVNVEGTPPIEETERVLGALVRVSESLEICAGDLLVWAEDHYGDEWTQVIPMISESTDLKRQSLLNAKSVMGRIPLENRIEKCPFKAYDAVSSLPACQQKVELDGFMESDESANDFYRRLHPPRQEQDYFVSIVCKDCGSVQEISLDRFAKVKEDNVSQTD